jgi:Gpi18-like mannosyltransferase
VSAYAFVTTVTARLISPSRRTSLIRLVWRLETPAGLVAMFAVAFFIRLLIAPHMGFYGDLRLFRIWAARLDEVDPHRFYAEGQFADYPPGYLYVLWLLGKLSSTPGYLLLKLPAILADLGLAWIAGTFAVRIAPASLKEQLPVRALVAAAVLFNPAVIALSAVWGQVDAVPALFVLASLLLLFTGPQSMRREIGAFLLFAVAIAMKPQSGFVLPIMLYALCRRHLYRRPRSELLGGALRIAAPGVLALDLWSVSGIPFGLGPVELLHFYSHSASVYPVTSANAFNLWGAVGFWRNDSMGDHVVTVAGLSALHFGMLAFAVGVGLTLWRLHRAIERGADEARALTVAAAIVSVLAYALLTRMHERYMFLSLACLAPLVFLRPLRLALAGLSGLFVLNLWYPYAYFNAQWQVQDLRYNPWFDWTFGGFQTDSWQKKVWSLAVTAIAILLAWRGIRWVRELEPLRGSARGSPSVPFRRPPSRQPSTAPPVPVARGAPPADDASHASPANRWTRWLPIALVGVTCLFCLVILRGETSPAPNLNDSAFHLQMVRWADGQIGEGRVPLDGWYPYLSLGSAQFHHYQSLPHTITAYVARATGASDERSYLWMQYLLLALWPIAIYCGARLMGWGRWTAAAAAAVSPLIASAPGYGYEHGSYTWRGYGVYSQLWAMWLLPLAWGLTWRAVMRGRHFAAASSALALTIACHFITGYLALLTVGVWVIVLDGSFLRRMGRAALVAGGSLLVASWVLVPLIGDTKWTARSEYYKGTFFNDSYGARKVLGWLFSGRLFDDGRFPVVTLLVYVGLVLCIARARRDPRAQALLGAFTLSLLLFFGRPSLGPVLDLLPGFRDVQIHRFIMGVHLAGILLAGVGLSWLASIAFRAARRLTPQRYAVVAGAATVLLGVGVLAPAWTERASYDRDGAVLIRAQRAAEATDGRELDRLVSIVKARGDGRVYAGLRSNWGSNYKAGSVPVYAWLADRDVDALGFTFRTIASLSTDVEAAFDEANPAQYEMFNIRYLILPPDRQPSVPAKLLTSSGRYRLWEVQTSGYFQVIDRARAVTANRTNLQAGTRAFRESNLASRGIYPGVAFAGARGPAPTFAGETPPDRPPGLVRTQSQVLRDGVFLASVDAKRPAVVLLKGSYDPRWTVTVDGLPAKPAMMAPSLVGVEVPTGRHQIMFRYKPYAGYPLLLALGAIALLALALVPGRVEFRGRRTALRTPGRESQVNEARTLRDASWKRPELARYVPSITGIDERWAAAGAVVVIAIVVYAATLLRGVSSFDAAEMQTVPTVLGITHPTGYPLWSLLGFLWTKLFFLVSPALMMNLLSALLFALAAATVALISLRLGVRPVLAAVAGLTFAFAGETWARATEAEVHSLHTLLVAFLLLTWVAAEQTGSRRAALALIVLTAIGLAHHRLMAITGLPLILWFFVRHLKILRSKSFVFGALACGLTPLLVYLYIPIRAAQDPSVVNADTSDGSLAIIRGDVFASHETAFERESLARWWHALPSYGHLAVHWVGWVVVLLALAGAAQCALRRRPIFVGLLAIVLTTTWGLANRTDRDYRWLIVPLLVLCLFMAIALQSAMRILGRFIPSEHKRWALLGPPLAVLIPVLAVVMHFSTYDRSRDTRDAANGKRILSAVAPNAVIWSYWDVRTTLQYLTIVKHLRPDVTVLDHRSYTKYGYLDDAVVGVDVGKDSSFATRPYYFIPLTEEQRATVARRFALDPVLPIDLPYAFDYRFSGWLYRVRR